VVVEGDLTILDYQTTLQDDNSGGHITVDGYLRNRRDKLDFDIDLNSQKTGDVERGDINFELAIAEREFRVIGDVESEKQNVSRTAR